MSFTHPALSQLEKKSIIYTAMSKHVFYLREHISAFALEQNVVPLNPFMNFGYFVSDLVNRDLTRNANNNMVMLADEVWVFGNVSNGVLAEILLAKGRDIPIRYFRIEKPHAFTEIQKREVSMEEDVREQKGML